MVVLEPCFLFRETARLGMKDCLETPPSVFFGSDIVDRGGLSNFSASDGRGRRVYSTAQRGGVDPPGEARGTSRLCTIRVACGSVCRAIQNHKKARGDSVTHKKNATIDNNDSNKIDITKNS